MTAAETSERSTKFVCPSCGASLPPALGDRFACDSCGRTFEIVAGIPDLRLEYPDPYTSWEEDVARARELAAQFDELDFADLLREHWRHSGKPRELTERFIERDVGSAPMFEAYLLEIERVRGARLDGGDRFLELGCGTAALAAAAAARGATVVASDISLRWLVLAKKRLAEQGIKSAELVCCAAERPAFPPESFDVVAASDVIEHAADQQGFVAGCRRVVRSGGLLFLVTPNRLSLGLEPHVRLWGVGLLPRRLAKSYVRAVRKAPYDHVRLLSARALRGLLRSEGFEVEIVPPEISSSSQRMYGGIELHLVRAYNRLRRFAPARRVLLAVGPFFHVFARKGAT